MKDDELKELRFSVNGKPYELQVKPKALLLDVLRKELKLTGTRTGCEVSACGACTVNLDGMAVRACSVLALQANGREVVTIEGVADGEKLHPVQEAMVAHGAIECGFCTSGMVMSARALLLENSKPTREDIRKAIQGNICADSGYAKYIEAIETAAEKMQGGE
ncbi:MAG: (2Fe-2S)-binding protein [Syntrophorhabdaceae bacterium]|nr:(2Fe-2S)-binding protein [Syntrophorhabdaceae bacterium]MDD5244568.1 (2Fe-2S)-binding protein [Syntrophorhabdaceae bacterium]